MKAISLSVAFEVASGLAFAQGAADPMAGLRACSLMEREERLECLENLSRNIAPGRPVPQPPPGGLPGLPRSQPPLTPVANVSPERVKCNRTKSAWLRDFWLNGRYGRAS